MPAVTLSGLHISTTTLGGPRMSTATLVSVDDCTSGRANALSLHAAAAVTERAGRKAPTFCDVVRRFLRVHTGVVVASQKARMEAALKGSIKSKKSGKKKAAGGVKKKKKKPPPPEFEPWLTFLEELHRKTTSGAVKVEDFPSYVACLAPNELRGLNSACVTIASNTFPDAFDEKLAVLRETVRIAVAGFMHRQPGGALERAASGKTVEQMVREGAAPEELLRCGFRYEEVCAAGLYTPEQLVIAGFSG